MAEIDEAYRERNHAISALAHLFPSSIARTDIPGWDPEWHGCVYIELPTGQVSFHYHDRDAGLFDDLPPLEGAWDGHDKETALLRLAILRSSPVPGFPLDRVAGWGRVLLGTASAIEKLTEPADPESTKFYRALAAVARKMAGEVFSAIETNEKRPTCMKLTNEQTDRLLWLLDQGGEAIVDRYGRVVAGGEVCSRDAFPVWLNLIAQGMIEGNHGRLRLTSMGRDHAAEKEIERAEG